MFKIGKSTGRAGSPVRHQLNVVGVLTLVHIPQEAVAPVIMVVMPLWIEVTISPVS